MSTVDVRVEGPLALDGGAGFSWCGKVGEVGDRDDDTIPLQIRTCFFRSCSRVEINRKNKKNLEVLLLANSTVQRRTREQKNKRTNQFTCFDTEITATANVVIRTRRERVH